jgi:hypothetical protein
MYDKKVTSHEPTLLILLLDQSDSMSETMAETEQGEVYSIAKVAKIISDTFLYTAMRKSLKGDGFKPYIDLAVIGYGDGIRSALPKIPLEQFPFSVKKLENTFFAKNDSDPDDNSVIPKPRLEWVEERADKLTPMLTAFTKARAIVEKWLPDHQESFPPVIINISDGMPTDDPDFIEILQQSAREHSFHLGDLSQIPLMIQSKAIRELGTNNGKCLVMNCHISPAGYTPMEYASSSAEAEEVDPFAKFMFEMSSVIPEPLFEYGIRPTDADPPGLGLKLEPNARFFVFNAEIESVIRFMTFGSSGSLGNSSSGQLPP